MDSKAKRDLVRRGYDLVSDRYRTDDGGSSLYTAEQLAVYTPWIDELTRLLPPHARVLDLGCGNGLPATRLLVEAGCEVTGLDFSPVQIERARRLVPAARFVEADMAGWDAEPGSLDAVVSFYALIHVPVEDQQRLLPRIRRWLKPGGHLLAIVGHERWTGVEEYLGADMFWDHADGATYLEWLAASGLTPIWSRFVPEGASGHTLVLARRAPG